MLTAKQQGLMLNALEKAVHSGNIAAVVPEDLEIEAHNLLWRETDAEELAILKYLPSVPAKSVAHEYTNMTGYGVSKGTGHFGERALPGETNFSSQRFVVNIRLMGEVGPTFLLAGLEETQKWEGMTGAQNFERVALRRNVLQKKARNVYFMDTTTTRLGNASLKARGLLQQIREGTDGTVLTSPLGASHVIDMLGLPLTPDTVRDRVSRGIQVYGRFTCLFMDPLTRGDFEKSMDGANRLNFPLGARPYHLGSNIAGLQTQGGVTRFVTDNTLSAMYSHPQYTAAQEEGAPTTLPTVTGVVIGAPGGGRVSIWDAASAGTVYYVLTEVVNEKEGLGVRSPATPATYHTVAAGQEVAITVTPGTSIADSFRLYRGVSTDDGGLTSAWFIQEAANSGGGGAVVIYDLNAQRPNTGWAFGLNLHSRASKALLAPNPTAYFDSVAQSASFLTQNDMPNRNTCAVAHLGPQMGEMQLAPVLATLDRPLLYSAYAAECRNPWQQVAFRNIGRL